MMQPPPVIKELLPLLQNFEPISLEELEAADLLERKDLKFIFPVYQARPIVQLLKDHFRVLEVKGYRYTDYETVYYDTDSFKFYFEHHNESLNRFKIRTRRYVQSDITFFETKFKNNKGWISKQREPIETLFLDGNVIPDYTIQKKLSPKIKVDYIRVTFVSNNGSEKVTLDFNIKFNHYCPTIGFDNLVIAEMKSRDFHNNIFTSLIRGKGIEPLGISKYCLGIAHVYPEVRHNNFKEKILKIEKIEKR